MEITGQETALNTPTEVQKMALANLADWNEEKVASACGSACGAGDEKKEEKPSACGSACGAGDEKKEEKPSACGSACGAGGK